MARAVKLPPCNPEVYRRAAELIQIGQEEFCCFAIGRAVFELGAIEHGSMYQAQFAAGFAPNRRPLVMDRGGFFEHVVDPDYPDDSGRNSFWSLDPTPARKVHRITSLLLMADMCESVD